MKDDNAFPKMLTSGRNLKTCIAIGLCCYLAMLSLIVLTHEHTAHTHSEENCTACFYNSQHVGVEITTFALIFPSLFDTTFSLYESVFLPLESPTNTQSRAPPVFFNELSIAIG